MTTIDSCTHWSTILIPDREETAPADISFERWGLLFGGQPDPGLLRLAITQYVVELYRDDQLVFAVPAYRAPTWGIGFPPACYDPPARDPRKLRVPLVCTRGTRLRFRFVQCVGSEPVPMVPMLVLEGK